MKKLIVGLLAAFLMTTGLVAFTGSPATAACPYQTCDQTATVAVASVKGTTAKIKSKTVSTSSNATPQGNVFLTVSKKKKNGTLKVVSEQSGAVNGGGKIVFLVEGLKKGKYKFASEFKGNQVSEGFGYSVGFGKFKIKK